MPRDGTKNLVPQSKRTKEEQRKIASQGGKASAKARRERKMLKDCLQALLDADVKDKSGTVVSGAEALSSVLFKKALSGDIRAFEVLRDTAGQSPKVQIEVEQETSEQDELTQALKGIADGLNKGGK